MSSLVFRHLTLQFTLETDMPLTIRPEQLDRLKRRHVRRRPNQLRLLTPLKGFLLLLYLFWMTNLETLASGQHNFRDTHATLLICNGKQTKSEVPEVSQIGASECLRFHSGTQLFALYEHKRPTLYFFVLVSSTLTSPPGSCRCIQRILVPTIIVHTMNFLSAHLERNRHLPADKTSRTWK